jgi:hypothetical protein
MSKKSNLFSDQTSSSRIERIKHEAINKTKLTYDSGFRHKNNTEKNSNIDALARVRGGGYVTPQKNAHRPLSDPHIPKQTCCEKVGEVIVYER